MFKLQAENKFKTKVNVHVPNMEGESEESSFTAVFKIVGEGEVPKDKSLLDVALLDVEEVDAPDGMDKEKVIEALKAQPHIYTALRSAYQAAVVKKNAGSIL